MYDEVALSRWIENAVYSAGITLILGAVLRGVSNEDRRIRYIDLATRYGDVRLTANAFVDATGDAALAWHAGLPCREPEKGTVYGSHMVVVEGINEEKYPEREEISRRLKERAGDYGLIRRDGFAFAFPGRGTALVNMTHVETPLEPVAAAAKAIEGKAQADKTVQFLKLEFPEAFGNARVRSYGFPGFAKRAGSSGGSSSRSTMCAQAGVSRMPLHERDGLLSFMTGWKATLGRHFLRTMFITCQWGV